MFSLISRIFKIKPTLQKLDPNWDIPNPEYVWFADKPTHHSNFVEAKKTPLQEVEAALGMQWTEMVLGEKNHIKKILSSLEVNHENSDTQVSKDLYLQRLKYLTENCVIRWLDNEIGWVLTLRPGKILEKGFLTSYTGILKSQKRYVHSTYELREYFFELYKTEKNEIIIDAKNNGNWARLLPFLLEEDQLHHFTIDLTIKDKIAVANLQFKFAFINGIKLPCVFAPEQIVAPEDKELLLGLNYSLQYLSKMHQQNKVFKLLDKHNFKQLDPTLYSLKMISCELEGLNYKFEIPLIRIMLAKQFPRICFRTVGCDEEKKEYYEITVSDAEIFATYLENPEAKMLMIKPLIKRISQDEFNKIRGFTS